MVCAVSPHFGKPSLHRAPRGDPRTVQYLEQRQESMINLCKRSHAFVRQEGQVPFQRSTTGSLEIDPSQSRLRVKNVAAVRFPVERPLSKDATIKRCLQIIESRAQELPINRDQGGYADVIEQRGPGIVQSDSEIRECDAAVVKCTVKIG
jgi:hypothetical protein